MNYGFLEKSSSSYAYDDLLSYPSSDGMRKLYNDVKKSLAHCYFEKIDLKNYFTDPMSKKYCYIVESIDFGRYNLSWEEATRAVYAVYYDYPIFYFIDKYKVGGSPDRKFISPVADYEFNRGDVRQFYSELIKKFVTDISQEVTDTKSVDKAKRVYDIMKSNSKYDHVKGTTNFVDTPSHSIIGYVRNGAAVCQGFTETYQIIMNSLGVPTIRLSGMLFQDVEMTIKDGSHARNLVFIEEEQRWAMVDVTIGISTNSDRGFDIPVSLCRFRAKTESERNIEAYKNEPNFKELWQKYYQSR